MAVWPGHTSMVDGTRPKYGPVAGRPVADDSDGGFVADGGGGGQPLDECLATVVGIAELQFY